MAEWHENNGEIESVFRTEQIDIWGVGTAAYPQSQPHGCCESNDLGARDHQHQADNRHAVAKHCQSFGGILPALRNNQPHQPGRLRTELRI